MKVPSQAGSEARIVAPQGVAPSRARESCNVPLCLAQVQFFREDQELSCWPAELGNRGSSEERMDA